MHVEGDSETAQDGYILIGKEDIADGIACFMASYLLSLEQTKVCWNLLYRLREESSHSCHKVKRKEIICTEMRFHHSKIKMYLGEFQHFFLLAHATSHYISKYQLNLNEMLILLSISDSMNYDVLQDLNPNQLQEGKF